MEKQNKKEMIEKAKEIRQQTKDFNKKLNVLYSKKFRYSTRYENSVVHEEDGKAYINVDLTKVENPFSVYSYDSRLDPEIYNYINDGVYYLRAEIPLVINIDDGGKYSDELKDKIKKCIIRHYSLEYEDKRLEHSKTFFMGILLGLIGVSILAVYILLSTLIFKDNNIFIEIICILSWVFVWQSADAFFFSGHTKRVDIYNAGQLALAEVTFGPRKSIK